MLPLYNLHARLARFFLEGIYIYLHAPPPRAVRAASADTPV